MNPKNSFSALTNRMLAAAIFLIVLGAFFRVLHAWVGIGMLPNFSPLAATALCGAAFLPGSVALLIPFAALMASDILLNAFYGVPLVSTAALPIYACYIVAWACGTWLRARRVALLPLLGLATANTLLFYLVTNTAAWLGLSGYAQNFAGWMQALTVGLPGYPPTWVFLRNSLVSDLLFTGVFYAVVKMLQERREATPAAAVPAQ